jgi:small conductance mechanosensitive channel
MSSSWWDAWGDFPWIVRFGGIVLVATVAHVAVLGVRAIGRAILESRARSRAKVATLTAFASSTLVFIIYFVAIGALLREFGISLAAYLASASIVGLAVSFGSQGVVQDVITGLTLVLSDLIDVGDMVEVGGQVGIVESVGIRFTVLVNFSGAHVSIPNRTIGNVVNFPRGYVRAYVDARLPADPARRDEAEARLRAIARSAYEQFPGILLAPASVLGREETSTGDAYFRLKFRIWPGQGAVVEGPVRQRVVRSLQELDGSYSDWMVAVHYRAEPHSGDPDRRLPKPSAVLARLSDLDTSRHSG